MKTNQNILSVPYCKLQQSKTKHPNGSNHIPLKQRSLQNQNKNYKQQYDKLEKYYRKEGLS